MNARSCYYAALRLTASETSVKHPVWPPSFLLDSYCLSTAGITYPLKDKSLVGSLLDFWATWRRLVFSLLSASTCFCFKAKPFTLSPGSWSCPNWSLSLSLASSRCTWLSIYSSAALRKTSADSHLSKWPSCPTQVSSRELFVTDSLSKSSMKAKRTPTVLRSTCSPKTKKMSCTPLCSLWSSWPPSSSEVWCRPSESVFSEEPRKSRKTFSKEWLWIRKRRLNPLTTSLKI